MFFSIKIYLIFPPELSVFVLDDVLNWALEIEVEFFERI